jgi:Zn finger protein HypA/HybF involved in hydrogenase expression
LRPERFRNGVASGSLEWIEGAGVDSGEIRFECLRCGRVSRVEPIEALRPRCSKCGSGTGVLGDIGQGTLEERLRRRNAPRGADEKDINFECLSCGTVTLVRKMEAARPGCVHCGSKDGVVVSGG